MKKKIFSILILTAAMVVFTGCEDMLEVDPRASLTEDQVLKDVATTQAFLNSALANLRNQNYYGRDFVLSPELLSDNTKLVNAADRSGRGLNQSINLSGTHLNIYFIYQAISRLNLIVEAAESGQIEITSQADNISITRIHAQALFLRGLFYFDLVRTYSYNPNYIIKDHNLGIPYLTKGVTAKDEIEFPSRPTVLATYEGIEADLKKSIELFTATGAPNPAAAGKVVPTRGAAQALLARVYLYWAGPVYPEKYQLAIDYATEAIASGVAAMSGSATPLGTNWLSIPNGESLFEVAFASTAENLGPDNCLQCWYTRNNNTAGVRVNGWGDVIASDELVASYGASDFRLTQLMRPAQRNFEPASSRETLKYNAPGATFGLDNVPVIRLPEMYLIRAEAHYYKPGGPDEVAVRDNLNAVIDAPVPTAGTVGARTNATEIDATVTGAALEAAIFNERRKELAFEGHRWFDFTRRGIAVQKPAGSTISYDDFRILANIPLVETQANKNLQQNPGY